MRKYNAIYILLFVITSIEFLSGQNTENTEENKIDTPKRAIIYPGCGKYIDSNEQLHYCFNKSIKRDLNKEIKVFEMAYGHPKVKVNLLFTIQKNGHLKLESYESNDIGGKYDSIAIEAFQSLSHRLNALANKNKGIVPALNHNDMPVIMEYSIPVTFAPAEKTKRQLRKEMKRRLKNK